MPDTLTVIDNRTGKQYEIPILYGTYSKYGAAIPTAELRNIKISEDDFGLLGYDPAFNNTASCRSSITHICLLYTSPSPRDRTRSRMPSSA